jgi:hypothetical protein
MFRGVRPRVYVSGKIVPRKTLAPTTETNGKKVGPVPTGGSPQNVKPKKKRFPLTTRDNKPETLNFLGPARSRGIYPGWGLIIGPRLSLPHNSFQPGIGVPVAMGAVFFGFDLVESVRPYILAPFAMPRFPPRRCPPSRPPAVYHSHS